MHYNYIYIIVTKEENDMPSSSYAFFQKNIETVTRLQDTYSLEKKVRHNRGGRGAFDHISRSAVIFLISAFEVYCESILVEASDLLIKNSKDAKNLPHEVRSTICEYVKIEGNHTSPLALCDEGWRIVYRKIVKEQTDKLNTPNTNNLTNLFSQLLGIKDQQINKIMLDTEGKNILDPIIRFRGEITHRVKANQYVHIETVEEYKETIRRIVIALEETVCDYIKEQSPSKKQPWNKTYQT